jgi:hypothetical protein
MRGPDIISVVTVLSVIGLGALFYVKSGPQSALPSPRLSTPVDATTVALKAISDCRLVGIWRAQPAESFDRLLDDARGARQQHDLLEPEPAPNRPAPRAEVFLPDGSWKTANVGGDKTWTSQWSVVEDRGDKVTIEMDDPETPGKRVTRAFVFDSADIIHEVGGMFDGMKYKRASSK